MFLIGMRDGMLYLVRNICAENASGLTGLTDKQKLMFAEYCWNRHQDFHNNLFVLENVITSLYEDPANTYIDFYELADIAMKKLKGQDIEQLLREARKEALNYQTKE